MSHRFDLGIRSRMGCVWTAAALWAAGAAEAATVTWKSAVSGNWNDGTKWSSGAPPAVGDTAVIDVAGTYTVTVNTTATVAGLTVNAATGRATVTVSGGLLAINGPGVFGAGGALNVVSGGTLGGSGDVTVGRFNWSGGQVEGAGKLIFPVGATVDFVDGGQHALRDRRIVNATTVNWPTVNGFLVGFGTVWDNEASGVVDLKQDVQVVYWGGTVPVFNNAGVLKKTGGAAQGYFDWSILNSGSVQQNSGTLNLRQGGTLSSSWSVGTGATLALSGGTFSTHASTSLGGAGRYLINAGALNSSVAHSTGVFIELASGGTIQGSADLTLAGKFVWSGGQVEGAGKLIFPVGATVDFVDGGQHALRDRRIVNATTVNWPTVNGFLVGFGTVWDNEPTGVVDLKQDVQVVYWGGTVPVFNNAGLLKKTGGAAQGYFDWSIVNSGSVQQNSGTLNLRQGGTLSSSWSVGTGATLALSGGTFSTHASTSLGGAGRYLINAGALNSSVAHSTGVFIELASGGTIQGSADLTLAGKFVWSGGQVEGTGKLIFPVGATVDFVDGGQHALRDRRIVNRTTVNWPTVNGFLVGFGTVWDNEASGVVDLKQDAQVVYWGGTVPVFNNAGLLKKTGGAAQGYFDWSIVNSGSVQQNSGTLNLRQGGTLSSSWSVGTGATLALSGGTFSTHASTSLGGAGRYLINAGALNSSVAHSTGVFIELASGGTIQGSADLTLAGKFVWSGGQVEGTGKLIFPVGATVDFVDGGQHALRDRRIVNATTVNWPTVNGFLVGFGTVWDNEASGVVDLKQDAQVVYWGGTVPVFNNAGVLKKTGGAAQGYFDWSIVNSGSVQQNSGTLNLRQGGTLSSSWAVGTGATLALSGGTFSTHASTSLGGAGRYLINAGALNSSVAHSTGVFIELASGGTIQGSADLTFAGKFVWSGGQVEGTGKLIFPVGATVDFVDGGQHALRDRRIVNATTVNWPTVNGFLVGFGTAWDNEASGVVDLKQDAQVVYWGGTVPVFNNAGVLRKTGGTAQGYFDFGLRNTGTVRLEKGTLNFRQGLIQTAGSLELAGGNYDGGPALLDVRGGVLAGAGNIGTGVSVAGELRPGNPLGKLQAVPNWNVTNTPGSVSVFQLGGTQAGVTYDQYFTGGSLNLGGELRIEFANGFEPTGADVFEVMRGGQRKGTFNATNAPAGFLAEVTYSTTNVTLRLTKTAVVAPEITDQPDSLSVTDGQPASFSVVATGSSLTYEWRRDGNPIPGATGSTYTIPSANFSDEGQYTVVVANAGGSRTSTAAILTVNPTNIDSGLIARFPLDSDVLDAVGAAEGTIVGTTNFVAAGARGGAFRFTGGNYIRLGANPALPIVDPAHAFSAGFWIRPRQQKEMVPIRLATPEGEFALYLSSGNNGDFATHFGFRGFASPATTDARSYVGGFLGCWTHVTVVYKGGPKDLNTSFALFINGEEMPLNARQTMNGGTGENALGTNTGGVNGWVNGDLDEVRIYARALRPQDAVELAQDAPDCTVEIVSSPVATGSVLLGGILELSVNAIGRPPLVYQWFRNGAPIAGATNSLFRTVATVDSGGTYRVEVSNPEGTTSSGNSSITVTLPPPAGLANVSLGIPNYISGASFINAYAGCVSFRGFGGGGGGVCITANGGQTWTVSNVGVTNDINAIQLVGGVGYIAGSSGLLCISTNGGASWNSFVTGTSATFNGLTFLNSTYGFAVGSGGTICIYNGRTWAPTPADAGVDFYGAAFAGDVAWAVGSGGAICRYVGGSWVPWATGTSVNFYGVSFLNPNFGFAVGAGGTICRWNGTTWVALNSGTTGTFRSVVIVDSNTAYVAGDNGLLCITRDGGNTWEPLGTGGNGSYGSLALSGGRAFVFGAGGTGFNFSVPSQVLNQPPTIRIVNPTNTQQFYACFRMNVSALANDPDGSITNVTFYRGQFKLAEISTPPRPGQPYRTSFYTDTFGEYVLTAVATDNRGSVTVSEPVTVSVVPPPQDTAVAEAFTDEAGCILCFMGQIGGEYVLQGTLDLNPPIVWVNLSTNTVPEPLLRVNDLDALNHPYRFYRFVPYR